MRPILHGPNRWFGKAAPRRRSVGLALTLALSFGSLAQPAPAQTQPADFAYQVDVVNPTYTMCLDDTRDMLVRILVSGNIDPNGSMDKATLTLSGGTTLTGLVADSSVGDFTTAHTQLINSPSPSLIRPALVAFTFKAKKAGETTVTFDADILEFGRHFQAQPAAVVVTVENCPYDIKTTSHFKIKGEDYTAEMDWTELKAKANGDYVGQGEVTWFAHWQVVPPGLGAGITCVTTLTAPPSLANLTGKVNDKGQLVVNIAFDPVKNPSWHVVCSGSGGAAPPIDRREFMLAPAPLTIVVPASTGGSATQPHALIDTINGKALTFDVVPVKIH